MSCKKNFEEYILNYGFLNHSSVMELKKEEKGIVLGFKAFAYVFVYLP